MMRNIFKEWIIFRDTEKDFDLNYFDNLFEGDLTEYDYDFILENMNLSYRTKSRLIEVKSFSAKKTTSDEIIKNEILFDIKEKTRTLRENGFIELSNEIENIKEIKYCSQDQFLDIKKQDSLQSEINVCLNDTFIDNMKYKEKIYYSINEAIYNIHHDYNINWYVLNEICNVEFNMEHYIKIFSQGYEYSCSENKILYSLRQN
ncbi:hypothetical protein Q4485_00860 [Granulosicoccaceae sp. 1_MG-2023]|nr:hypothetical protein [Granulosicoccaceae sp. 1_MG-2023]